MSLKGWRSSLLHAKEEATSCSAALWDGQFEFFPCKTSKNEDRDDKVLGEILTCSPGECHLPVKGQLPSHLTLERCHADVYIRAVVHVPSIADGDK